MKRMMTVFLFGFVTILSGAAQSETGSASLGAGLEGASVRHSSLPFGTRLKVINSETGREVEVIVAGRLPADTPQALEISESVAEELGVSPEGVSTELYYQVQAPAAPPVPAVPPVPPPLPAPASPPSPPPLPPPVIPPVPAPPAASRVPAADAPAPVLPPARIIPAAPDPESTLVYRIQAGSYKSVANARAAFDRVNGAGFRAAYERFGGGYRIVVSGIPASGIHAAACRLGAAGFPEIWIRPEN